jgi:hypothetical protein
LSNKQDLITTRACSKATAAHLSASPKSKQQAMICLPKSIELLPLLSNKRQRQLPVSSYTCITIDGLVRLAGSQPASNAFLSHQFSTSQQPPVSQQYFSLTIN